MNRPYIVILLSVILTSCNSDMEDPKLEKIGSYSQTSTIVYNEVAGVDKNLLSLDIYHFNQSVQERPVVIYVHGGGWAIGDKTNALDNKIHLFESLGYIFISVNYRLSPSNLSFEPNRIMYPTHNNDVVDAVVWVYNNISAYGGDPLNMVLMGHSAGAHLVTLTGTSQDFLPSRGMPLNTIKGIASIDTEGYDISANAGENIYINAFGTDPEVWFEASPIYAIQEGVKYPKFFIAKRGTSSRIELADDFIAKLEMFAVSVSQVDGSMYDHEGINNAIGADNEAVITDPFKEFLSDCFNEQ